MKDKIGNVARIGIYGDQRRNEMRIIASFLFSKNIEIVLFDELIEETRKTCDLDETMSNEEIISYFVTIIEDNQDKALEIINKTNYIETKPSPSPMICIDEPHLLNPFDLLEPNLLKDKPDRPWDTKKDFYTKVMRRGYKHKRK